jgi:hypothetical protein
VSSSEVQRTLVKSPPELWAELSDPASLARHLGELGEIRVTRTEPEELVEWEAQDVSGTVRIKPSGWGTKVTLTVLREETPEPEAEEAREAEGEPEAGVAQEVEPTAQLDDVTTAQADPEPRIGFFARLFRRRRRAQTSIEPELELEPSGASEPEPAQMEPELAQTEPEPAQTEPEPAQTEPEPAQTPDLAAELAQVEEALSEQDAALLSGVLDRLGAAHHRPFSRS